MKNIINLLVLFCFFSTVFLFSNEKITVNRKLSFGIDYQNGNTDSIGGNMDFNLKYINKNHTVITDVDCNYIEDKKEDIVIADSQKMENSYKYQFSEYFHASLYSYFYRDIPSNIDSTIQGGVGLGATLYKTEKASLSYDIIFAYSKKEYTDDLKKENLEIKNIFLQNYSINDEMNFSCNLQYNVNGEDEKDYSIFINPEITMHIIKNFSFSCEVIYDYYNIPALGAEKDSTLVKSKLVYSF